MLLAIWAVSPDVLEKMRKQLAQMTAAHAQAEERLSKVTVDEAGFEKVVRDTPM